MYSRSVLKKYWYVIRDPLHKIDRKELFFMEFTYIITKNNKPLAGFTDFIDACNYKSILFNTNRTAGYKDKYEIIDTRIKKLETNRS